MSGLRVNLSKSYSYRWDRFLISNFWQSSLLVGLALFLLFIWVSLYGLLLRAKQFETLWWRGFKKDLQGGNLRCCPKEKGGLSSIALFGVSQFITCPYLQFRTVLLFN